MLEQCGSAIRNLSMDGRMTICNMSIELAPARAWWSRPGETKTSRHGATARMRRREPGLDAVEYWKTPPIDEGATFDAEVFIDVSELEPS